MLVKNWLRTGEPSLNPDSFVLQAYRLMKDAGLEAIAVVRESRPMGMITERDLRGAFQKAGVPLDLYELMEAISNVKIQDVVCLRPVTVDLDATLEEAAEILLKNRIMVAPVVDKQGHFAGTISMQDLFKVLVSLSGAGEGGIHWGLRVADQPGAVRDVYDVLWEHGCRVLSMMSTIHDESGKRHVYIRVCECNEVGRETMVENMRKVAEVLYMVDLGKGKRELYGEYPKPKTECFVG